MQLMQRLLISTVLVASAPFIDAQQKLEFKNGRPVRPAGMEVPPLPDQPTEYKTAEVQDIRVVVVARNLDHPWSIALLDDGTALVTERKSGQLRVIRDVVLDQVPVAGLPEISTADDYQLYDVVLHPQFAQNNYVYLSYHKRLINGQAAAAVARGRWDGRALIDTDDVFVSEPGTGLGARMAFGRDRMLYVFIYGSTRNRVGQIRHSEVAEAETRR